MLDEFAGISPLLVHWYYGRTVKKIPSPQLNADDVSFLADIIYDGRNRNRIRVFEELGFSCHFSTHQISREELHCLCGSFSTRRTMNRCSLSPGYPKNNPEVYRITSIPVLLQIISVMARAWDAQVGCVCSYDYRYTNVTLPVNRNPDCGGWITYIAGHNPLPALPAGVEVRELDDHGRVVLSVAERFDAKNPHHVEMTNQVVDTLGFAGMFDI